jgi:hypothetical protein
MDDFLKTINSLMSSGKLEQWPMSAADNEPGMSLPEVHPAYSPAPDVEEMATTAAFTEDLYQELESPSFSAEDPVIDDVPDMVKQMFGFVKPMFARADKISDSLDKLLGQNTDRLMKAKKDMFMGAALKTAAAAGDVFDKAVGLIYGADNIESQKDIAVQNYQNRMDALDNQVLYVKHQLANRFNKTVETNIMNLAARNLRVNAGNVLDLSKEEASEITEDMREAESNARLQKIALEAGKKSARESARYAKTQLWTGLAKSAVNLGLMYVTGGGTDQKFGDLYKGYKQAKDYEAAKKAGALTGMY